MNTALTFCYQLQGFAEISNEAPLKEQWIIILKKLAEVSIDDLIIETDVFLAPEIFVVWIKGFVDVAEPTNITSNQWQIIKDHLQLVFTKVTPSYEDEDDEHFPDVSKNIKDALEQWQSTDIIPPFKPVDVICNNLPTMKKPDRAYCSRHKRMC